MPCSSPRRFRFGLRSLFVLVTVVACWLGYQVNWIRERRAMEATEGHPIHPPLDLTPGRCVAINFDECRAPGVLWLFGEKGFSEVIYFAPGDPAEIERARRLFPEADVHEFRID